MQHKVQTRLRACTTNLVTLLSVTWRIVTHALPNPVIGAAKKLSVTRAKPRGHKRSRETSLHILFHSLTGTGQPARHGTLPSGSSLHFHTRTHTGTYTASVHSTGSTRPTLPFVSSLLFTPCIGHFLLLSTPAQLPGTSNNRYTATWTLSHVVQISSRGWNFYAS